MDLDLNDLTAKASALASRFADVGAKLADAARALQQVGAPPDDALVEELAIGRDEFLDLRDRIIAAAEQAGLPPPVALENIQSLEPAITAIAPAAAAQRRRAALEQARAAVLGILDSAATLVHREEAEFAPLQACYAKAAGLRAAIEVVSDAAQAQALTDSVRAFADLLALVEGARTLAAEVLAQLEDNVARAFGGPLAAAAARGLLAMADDLAAERAAALAAAAGVRDELQPPPEPEAEAVMAPPPATPAPSATPAPVLEPPRSRFVAAAPRDALPTERAAGAPGADDSAQWWLAAWARWSGWKNDLSFADAVREEVGKYPYLLSVPIQDSPKYEEGLAAYGYSILLDHVERQTPGCVANALNSLQASSSSSVGDQLYAYLVTHGRLSETYADFIREVLVAALPAPGMWFEARVADGKDHTRLFNRPTRRIGESEQTPTRLNSDGQRFTTHHFTTVVLPLTTRFFLLTVEPKELRSADVRITRDGAPSDSAWLATASSGPKARVEPQRVSTEGTTVGALGHDATALWIAVFNADPVATHEYTLALGFRKDARTGLGGKSRTGRA